MQPRILLTSACSPFPSYGYDEPLMDVFTNRLTKGQDLFTMRGHFHFPPLHTIAQNIAAESVVLEAPTWEMFEAELARGYEFLGITCNIVHMETIFKMCRRARELAPDTKIILGGYGVQCLSQMCSGPADIDQIADHVCRSEGIKFTRELLGEPIGGPVREDLPSCLPRPAWMPELPRDDGAGLPGLSFLTSGLGCPQLCEFCSTSHFFNGRYLEVSDADTLYAGLARNAKRRRFTMMWDEDFFRRPKKARRLLELMQQEREWGIGKTWFVTFGSVQSLSQFTVDELLMMGVGGLWIGVESLFTDLKKRQGKDIRELFAALHRAGIFTIGSWIGGWDFHDRHNIIDDREFFISLGSTFSQISELLAVPETTLWGRLEEEGRLFDDVAWADYHFYGDTFRFKNFERFELLHFIEDMHKRVYEQNGPSALRMFGINLNGYLHCKDSEHVTLREDKAPHFLMMTQGMRPMLDVVVACAPNGWVRRRALQMIERYEAAVGPTSDFQRTIGEYLVTCAKQWLQDRAEGKVEDFELLPKRYEYQADQRERAERGELPYRVSYPTRAAAAAV